MGDRGDAPMGMWAQRKEARRNMYATSTEQVRVHRRGIGATSSSSAAAMCQKCLKPGHWTYECKNAAVYVQRPSRSQQLKNPKLRQPFNQDKPPDLKEEAELAAEKTKKSKRKDKDSSKKPKQKSSSRSKSRRKRRRSASSSSSDSSSDSDSSSSGSDSSDSDSDLSSSGSSSSGSDSSDSESDVSSGSERSSRRHHRSKRRRRD